MQVVDNLRENTLGLDNILSLEEEEVKIPIIYLIGNNWLKGNIWNAIALPSSCHLPCYNNFCQQHATPGQEFYIR